MGSVRRRLSLKSHGKPSGWCPREQVPPAFLPLGPGAWGLPWGDQGTGPYRSPRAAPTPGVCGPWIERPPGEAAVRLGLPGQRGGGTPHGPQDGPVTAGQWRSRWSMEGAHANGGRAGKSHNTEITQREKRGRQRDSQERPGDPRGCQEAGSLLGGPTSIGPHLASLSERKEVLD